MDFLAEFQRLRESVPRVSLYNVINENCPFNNYSDRCKNCYLIVNAYEDEYCYYGRELFYDRDCIDCDHCHYCELCYQCLDCLRCYNSTHLQNCEQCTDCEYGYDLKDCTSCFMCVGLRQKKFHILNHPVSPEEYLQIVTAWKARGQAIIQVSFQQLKIAVPRLYSNIVNSDWVTGDYIKNSRECGACFDIKESRDCFYSYEVYKSEDCIDMTIGEFAKWNYECLSAYHLQNSNFCTMCWYSSDLEYCDQVFHSNNCFGCVYLNHKEFYILDKPYSRDEYFRRVAEIKDEMRHNGTYGKPLPSAYPLEDSCAVMEQM